MRATENDLLDIIAKESIIDRKELVRDANRRLPDLDESLDIISILFEIEDRYGVVIPDADLPKVETLGEIADFFLSRINQTAA